jgi:hypothetical protein
LRRDIWDFENRGGGRKNDAGGEIAEVSAALNIFLKGFFVLDSDFIVSPERHLLP